MHIDWDITYFIVIKTLGAAKRETLAEAICSSCLNDRFGNATYFMSLEIAVYIPANLASKNYSPFIWIETHTFRMDISEEFSPYKCGQNMYVCIWACLCFISIWGNIHFPCWLYIVGRYWSNISHCKPYPTKKARSQSKYTKYNTVLDPSN